MNFLHPTRSSYRPSAFTSCNVVPRLTIARCIPSIHLFLGLPTGLFGYLLSDLIMICPYHCRRFFSIVSNNGPTLSSALVAVFVILSLLVTHFIVLRTRISAACIFDSVLVARDQQSLPYIIIGFSIVL